MRFYIRALLQFDLILIEMIMNTHNLRATLAGTVEKHFNQTP